MARYEKPYSQAIKNYFDFMRRTSGRKSKDLAVLLDYSPVTMSNLAGRLDILTVDKLAILATALGVEPGKFFNRILELRAHPEHDIYATPLSKEVQGQD